MPAGRERRSRAGPVGARPSPVAVTVDLWYTLVYLRPRAQRDLDRRRRREWTIRLVRGGLSEVRAARAVEALERWCRSEERRGRTPAILEQAVRLTSKTGVRLSGSAVGRAFDALTLAAPVRVAPGAVEALRRLRTEGVRLAIVSNLLHQSGPGARRLLRKVGIGRFFSVTVFSSEHPWAKPRPEPFRFALRALGAGPGESVHVGDLRYDVEGAARAGMRAIVYTGLHGLEPPDLVALVPRGGRVAARTPSWTSIPVILRAL